MSGREYRIPSEPFPDRFNAHMAPVLEYWREKCTNGIPGPLPSLNDLNLMDLYKIADHLLLCDVVRQDGFSTRYRWRFWGSKLTAFFGVELTGRFIDEAYTAEAAGQIIATYDWIIENGAPHYWLRRGGLAFDGQEHLVYERLVCPVLGQSGDIDHLFGIITFVTGPTGKPEVAERPVGRKISISRVEGLSASGY